MKKRPDGRWQKAITLSDGKKKYFYSLAKTEREAIKDFNKQIIEYNEKETTGKLFSEVADEWQAEHFPTLQNNSLKNYTPALRQVREYFKDFRIKDIHPNHINAFIGELKYLNYAQKTVKTRFLVLNLIFKYGIISRYIDSNPCQYITLPKNLQKTKRENATPADIESVKSNTDKPFGIFALFLLMTGCRRGEALALAPSDIDLENKIVHITKTVEWLGNHPHIKDCPKTDAGVRDIPLPDFLIEKIAPFMEQKYLFPNYKGELMDNSQVTRAWDLYRRETGINATPHQFRHAYTTILFDAGIDVKTAQRWLGHSDIKTTLDIYTHLSETRLKNSQEKLMTFFSENFT